MANGIADFQSTGCGAPCINLWPPLEPTQTKIRLLHTLTRDHQIILLKGVPELLRLVPRAIKALA